MTLRFRHVDVTPEAPVESWPTEGVLAAFAEAIGTSPSRLSTYANGRVAPSATLLLRMERVAG